MLKEFSKREVTHKDTAAFFSDGWRRKLCTCTDCVVHFFFLFFLNVFGDYHKM